MTTIAARVYADRTELAADRRCTANNGGVRMFSHSKLVTLWGRPAAFAGSVALGREFEAWAAGQPEPSWTTAGLGAMLRRFAAWAKAEGFDDDTRAGGIGFVLCPGGYANLQIGFSEGTVHATIGDYGAGGSGYCFAVGAMAAGASPADAVACAAMHDTGTGDGVDVAVVPREPEAAP